MDYLEQNILQNFEALLLNWQRFVALVIDGAAHVILKVGQLISDWEAPLQFTPLQSILFKVLLCLLVATALFIAHAWHVYGTVITEKFVRPSTLKEIEELKLSVAKLKLPKEHSPRI